ncbi:MAG: NAD(P)-dependent oxidoreductase [Planctomycetes bacterium]|nr:NAD(P)-dependent oxidoreductase [Planctomycetota bacterium]
MILMTGATGFLGGHILRALLRQNWLVRPFVRDEAKYRKLFPKGPGPFVGDLGKLRRSDFAAEKVSGLMHAAAEVWPVDRADAAGFNSTNVEGSRALLDALDRRLVNRVVLISTITVYGMPRGDINELTETRPAGDYAKSKAEQEKLFIEFGERYNIPVAVLRMSSIYGPNQYSGTVLPRFLSDARANKSLVISGPPQREQNFIYVEDAAHAAAAALEHSANGIYNIGGAEETTLAELAAAVLRVTGARSRAIERPDAAATEAYTFHFDCAKAERELGWTPRYDLESGLRATLAAES